MISIFTLFLIVPLCIYATENQNHFASKQSVSSILKDKTLEQVPEKIQELNRQPLAGLKSLSWFCNTYSDCVQQFLNLKSTPEFSANKMQFEEVPIVGTDYHFQVMWIPAPGTKTSRTLVIQSGLHGIEGFTGSALQMAFLNDYLKSSQTKVVSRPNILLIHGLNAWGFANSRRTNQNNIDLNRNFLQHGTSLNNEGYQKMNSFLNPTIPYQDSKLGFIAFLWHAGKLIISQGLPTLRQSVLQGQYEYPKGIFYGGQAPQMIDTVEPIYKKYLDSQKEILFIDLHTGYGTRGQLHLLFDAVAEGNVEVFQKIFQGQKLELTTDKQFYQVQGGYLAYLRQRFLQKNIIFNGITFEFGTLNSNTTMGSLKSLHNMIIENQAFHQGGDLAIARQYFNEHFYPSDPSWRQQVMDQGMSSLRKALESMQ